MPDTVPARDDRVPAARSHSWRSHFAFRRIAHMHQGAFPRCALRLGRRERAAPPGNAGYEAFRCRPRAAAAGVIVQSTLTPSAAAYLATVESRVSAPDSKRVT
jgi:hypothetical protein